MNSQASKRTVATVALALQAACHNTAEPLPPDSLPVIRPFCVMEVRLDSLQRFHEQLVCQDAVAAETTLFVRMEAV